MKKIAIILSVIFASSIISSCVKPFEYTEPLGLTNIEVTLPGAGDGSSDVSSYIHHTQVLSTGRWEATLELANQDLTWCWLSDSDRRAVGYDEELGETVYEMVKIPNVTVLEYFDGTDKAIKIVGQGTLHLPLYYTSTASARYALLTVRNLDTGDVRYTRITQKP